VYGVIENPLQAKDLGGRPFVEYEDLQGHKHGFKTKAKTNWFLAPKKGEKIVTIQQKKITSDVIFYLTRVFVKILIFRVDFRKLPFKGFLADIRLFDRLWASEA
jgi:hypothetical protein